MQFKFLPILFLCGCAHHRVAAPSVAGVQSSITGAQASNRQAEQENSAAQKSLTFNKSDLERLDAKNTVITKWIHAHAQ